MNTNEILKKMKELAPNVAFDLNHEIDDLYVWDGDPNQNPETDDFVPHEITITAKTIHQGVLIQGEAVSTGHYAKYGQEPNIDDLLPQLLQDALDELIEQFSEISQKCDNARKFLEEIIRDAYNQQRRKIE